jgi:hypothetical protein
MKFFLREKCRLYGCVFVDSAWIKVNAKNETLFAEGSERVRWVGAVHGRWIVKQFRYIKTH